MCVEGVDVGQQGAHDGRHPWTHVLGRETREVPVGCLQTFRFCFFSCFFVILFVFVCLLCVYLCLFFS